MRKIKGFSLDRFIVYVLLGAIVVYFMQGSLYANGSTISRMSFLIWLFIDLVYTIKYMYNYRLTSLEKIIVLFWSMNSIYWLFSEKVLISSWGEPLSTLNNFKSICWTFLTYFPIRYFTKKGVLDDKGVSYFALLMLVVFIMSFFSFRSRLLYEYNREEITNNMGYRFVFLLPLLGFFRKTKFSLFFIGLALYFIIMSSKRGAIVCGALAYILYFIYVLQNVPRTKRIKYFVLIIMVLFFTSYYFYDVLLSNEYLMQRLANMESGDDVSGESRLIQTNAILNYVLGGSVFNLLFGYGFDKSVMMAGNYAHNDWAELLANLGIVGCIMYLIFFIRLIKLYTNNKKFYLPMQKYQYLSVVGIWLLVTMFSMGYISNNSFLFTIVIAHITSEIEKKKSLCQK